MEQQAELLQNWQTGAQVVLYVVSFNIFLTGLKLALEKIKDKTATNVDNKLHAVVSSVSGALSHLLDFFGFNPKH